MEGDSGTSSEDEQLDLNKLKVSAANYFVKSKSENEVDKVINSIVQEVWDQFSKKTPDGIEKPHIDRDTEGRQFI